MEEDIIQGHKVLRGRVLPRSLSTAGILHNLPYDGERELNLLRLQNQAGVISHSPRLVSKAGTVFTYAFLSGDCDFETLGISKTEGEKSSGREDVAELVAPASMKPQVTFPELHKTGCGSSHL